VWIVTCCLPIARQQSSSWNLAIDRLTKPLHRKLVVKWQTVLTFMTTASSHMHAKKKHWGRWHGSRKQWQCSGKQEVATRALPGDWRWASVGLEAQSTTKKYYIGLIAKGEHYCHKLSTRKQQTRWPPAQLYQTERRKIVAQDYAPLSIISYGDKAALEQVYKQASSTAN